MLKLLFVAFLFTLSYINDVIQFIIDMFIKMIWKNIPNTPNMSFETTDPRENGRFMFILSMYARPYNGNITINANTLRKFYKTVNVVKRTTEFSEFMYINLINNTVNGKPIVNNQIYLHQTTILFNFSDSDSD